MIDNLHDSPSGRIPDHPVWCRADSFAAWEMYLDGTPGLTASPYAAPSRVQKIDSLPPAFISVGDVDLFLDENADYAARLKQSGGICGYMSYPGVFHGGEVAGAKTRVGRRMIDDYVAALQSAFA